MLFTCVWKWVLFLLLLSTKILSKRKRGFINGNVMIGALFPIHKQPTIQRAYTKQCGQIREQYGMHRVEALIKTINEINENHKLLPGVTLGVEIRDTCWYAPIALEQSIDFIKNSIAHQEKMENDDLDKENAKYGNKPIASLIGPASSTVTTQIQNLLQLFKIPQIGYSATSIDLSKKEEYEYFLRVVPSDILQAKALMELIFYYKWEYISLLNSKGEYGSAGIKQFKEYISESNVCVDKEEEIDNKEEMNKFIEAGEQLFFGKRAKIIVCFCQGETVTKLLKAMEILNVTGKGFLLIGTDGWADRLDVLENQKNATTQERNLSKTALGSLSIRLHSPPIDDFDHYFRSKTYHNTKGNPWFTEFWEEKFNCYINKTKSNKYISACTGKESLYDMEYKQDTKLGFVVKSVMTVAWGLHNLLEKRCNLTKVVKGDNRQMKKCKQIYEKLNGTELLREMMKVSFIAYDQQNVSFDSKGDPPGRYEIMNYQITNDYVYKYELIGTWMNNKLQIIKDPQWPVSRTEKKVSAGSQLGVKSVCSEPCLIGQYRQVIDSKKCCWACKTCGLNQKIRRFHNSTNEDCEICPNGSSPDDAKIKCITNEIIYTQWSNPPCIIAVTMACIGLVLTTTTTIIFAKYNHTPIVKSSTRELMYVILAGVSLCYLSTFALLAKPNQFSCVMIRIMPGMSFSLIFGALVTKTNRICRILATTKKKIIRHKGKFLSTTAQIVITMLLNLIECSIILFTMYLERPGPVKQYQPKITRLICHNSIMSLFVPVGFDAVLVIFCTWYAFKTRNLPENFNEAKFIGFTMYTTCIIWIGLIPIYFGAEYKVISLCYAINLSATVTLFLLFFPKVYIILLKPEKNERSAFTTTSDIRCHIGLGKLEYKCTNHKKQTKHQPSSISLQTKNCSIHNNNVVDMNKSKLINSQNHQTVQTNPILIFEKFSDSSTELTPSQLALLEFVESNWSNFDYNKFVKFNTKPIEVSETLQPNNDEIMDEIGEDTSENTPLKRVSNNPHSSMRPTNNNIASSSPSSIVSADGSSNSLSQRFFEYFKHHGKRFCRTNNEACVKL